jgi:hypothetical protein
MKPRGPGYRMSAPERTTSLFNSLPRDCVTLILGLLPFRDLFSAARSFYLLREALLSGPIRGLPALEVESVVAKPAGPGQCEYVIKYVGCPEVDILRSAQPAAAIRLVERFRTHFIVVFTFDHRFLSSWTAAHGASRIAARKAKDAAKALSDGASGPSPAGGAADPASS